MFKFAIALFLAGVQANEDGWAAPKKWADSYSYNPKPKSYSYSWNPKPKSYSHSYNPKPKSTSWSYNPKPKAYSYSWNPKPKSYGWSDGDADGYSYGTSCRNGVAVFVQHVELPGTLLAKAHVGRVGVRGVVEAAGAHDPEGVRHKVGLGWR